jgi:hypothetical protein
VAAGRPSPGTTGRDGGRLHRWPKRLTVRHGHLNLAGTSFTRLPSGVRRVAGLDLRDCAGITRLPDDLEVMSWLDVGGSGVTGLPLQGDEPLV